MPARPNVSSIVVPIVRYFTIVSFSYRLFFYVMICCSLLWTIIVYSSWWHVLVCPAWLMVLSCTCQQSFCCLSLRLSLTDCHFFSIGAWPGKSMVVVYALVCSFISRLLAVPFPSPWNVSFDVSDYMSDMITTALKILMVIFRAVSSVSPGYFTSSSVIHGAPRYFLILCSALISCTHYYIFFPERYPKSLFLSFFLPP